MTNQDKIKLFSRAFELLRLEHNKKGEDFRNGKITEKEFRDYQKGEFARKMKTILNEKNKAKEAEGIFKIDKEKEPDNPKLKWEEEEKVDNKLDKQATKWL